MSTPIIARFLFEYRYKANPNFHSERGQVCKHMINHSSIFKHWELNLAEERVFDEERRYIGFVSSKRAGMHFDFPEEIDLNREIDLFTKATQENNLHPKLNRLGARCYLLFKLDSFEKGLELFDKKIFRDAISSFKEIGNPIDYSAVFDFNKGVLKGHIQIGPMKREQLFTAFIKSIPDEEIQEQLTPDSFIFIDYDLAQMNVSSRKIATHIKDFCNRTMKIILDDSKKLLINLGVNE